MHSKFIFKLFTLLYTFLSTLLLILYPSQTASDDPVNDFINNLFNSSGGGSTGNGPWYYYVSMSGYVFALDLYGRDLVYECYVVYGCDEYCDV
jgi:hypothetical protein